MGRTNITGYLHNTHEGLQGARGSLYDYILAANGVFVSAASPLLKATVQVAAVEVLGLSPLPKAHVDLPKGRIPYGLLLEALGLMELKSPNELCCEVVWDGGHYSLTVPDQEGTPGSVHYAPSGNALLTLHSHPDMGAFFSSTDDKDEQGLGLFGVVGIDNGLWSSKFRVGVYGHFQPVAPEHIFKECPWLTEST